MCNCQSFLTVADYLHDNITHLTEQDFENARKFNITVVNSSSKRRQILTQQRFYRGDLRGKVASASKHKKSGIRRNGVASVVKKWPNGRIPYVLSAQYNERERAILARAFQEYHARTCIRFTPKTAFDRDFLYIGKIDGCYSDVGRAGGRQELSLDDGCLQYDTIIHELMHSVGFYHEHERWDRDQYITILWPNIDREAYDQFGRVDLTESSYYEQPYDYHSIMHYDSMAFSKNGRETLVAKHPGMTAIIGSAVDFSPVDMVKIRKMYQCPSTAIYNVPKHASAVASPFRSMSRDAPLAEGLQVTTIASDTVAPTGACADKTSLCSRWVDRCHSVFFEKIMREFCEKTCGYCTPLANEPVLPRPLETGKTIIAGQQQHSLPIKALHVVRTDEASDTVEPETPLYRLLG
ncbi:astacin protease precursor [Aphelenchoides avenae]|nr:astacin protease precursor [Aphelenchus avenae]